MTNSLEFILMSLQGWSLPRSLKWKSFSLIWLCNTMGYIVHGILQARILGWVAFPFSRGSSQPRDPTQVSHIAGGFFTSWATREAHYLVLVMRKLKHREVNQLAQDHTASQCGARMWTWVWPHFPLLHWGSVMSWVQICVDTEPAGHQGPAQTCLGRTLVSFIRLPSPLGGVPVLGSFWFISG